MARNHPEEQRKSFHEYHKISCLRSYLATGSIENQGVGQQSKVERRKRRSNLCYAVVESYLSHACVKLHMRSSLHSDLTEFERREYSCRDDGLSE